MPPKIYSQHQWIDKIETLVPDTVRLKLRRPKDYFYAENINGQYIMNDADAFNFSNSDIHDGLIQQALKIIRKRANDAFVKHLLGELTFRKTYGAFSEMAAYEWMARAGIDFTPQVALGPAEVVNPNGSMLDGKFLVNEKIIYFDIKAFGFVDHKIAILKQKLENRASGDEILIEGGVSISIDDVQNLLERSGFEMLVNELVSKSSAERGSLTFRKRPRPSVSIGVTELDPNELAIMNREYALKFGGQFTRQTPFILFFVIHPWFSKSTLHQNVDSHTDKFCAEFAHQTFHTFDDSNAIRANLPTRDLVKLLSAIAFINVWPQASSLGSGHTVRIYLNVDATHSISSSDLAILHSNLGSEISILQV